MPLFSTTLAERLAKGEFTVTLELHPPRGFDITSTLERLQPVLPHVDAVNVADSPRAQGRMSALVAGSLIQTRLGVETILHLAIRHRNSLALHSDLLGAHALGVRNVFVVLGDKPAGGDYPLATVVSDVTSSSLIELMTLFNSGMGANGQPIEAPTSFFVGAALNLNAEDLDGELRVLERKVEAGARFLLTQPVYDAERIESVAQRLGGFPLPVLLGVLPLRTLRHATFLQERVPGIAVPPDVYERLERSSDVAAEGIALSQEIINASRSRIAGAYFMPPFERYVIVQEVMAAVAR